MQTKQGDLTLLDEPVAKELLQSTIPARLAYIGLDGAPRVIPIWFHWNGKQIILGTPETAPKIKALLVIAGKVQNNGKSVTSGDIELARKAGAADSEIHDTVLIAASFSMLNRYVDGLASYTPTGKAAYEEMGKRMCNRGYHI